MTIDNKPDKPEPGPIPVAIAKQIEEAQRDGFTGEMHIIVEDGVIMGVVMAPDVRKKD